MHLGQAENFNIFLPPQRTSQISLNIGLGIEDVQDAHCIDPWTMEYDKPEGQASNDTANPCGSDLSLHPVNEDLVSLECPHPLTSQVLTIANIL